MKSNISKKVVQFNVEKQGKITCIYGDSGSGKSYMAARLRHPNTIILDGDGVRHYINDDLGFSDDDRRENNVRISKIAQYLSLQGFDVIISTVRADIAYELLKEKVPHIELMEANHKR